MSKYSNLLSKIKPSAAEQTELKTEQTAPASDSVFDLSEHLKQKTVATPPPAPQTETDTTQAQETTEQVKDETPGFEDLERETINTLIDPDMIAEGLAEIVDLGRQMLYPKIYESLMFKPHEQKLLANPQLLKADAASFLNQKLEEFNGHVKRIEWEQKEKMQMIKHIFRPLADKLGPDSAITKYYPLLIVAAIEGKRFKAVANSSNTIFVEEKAPEQQPAPPFNFTQPTERAPAPPTEEQKQDSQTIDLTEFDA